MTQILIGKPAHTSNAGRRRPDSAHPRFMFTVPVTVLST